MSQVLETATDQIIPENDGSTDPQATPEELIRIGKIAFVSGSQIVILLEIHADDTLDDLHVGSLVKTDGRTTRAFGVISTLSVPLPAETPQKRDLMTAEIELLGEVPHGDADTPARFHRGITCPPALGTSVYLASESDLSVVYSRAGTDVARIGTIQQNQNVPAYVLLNELLGKHFAILGTTGSGKSCTTALILRAIIEKSPCGNIVLLDPHNEYSHAFKDVAEVFDTSNLDLPYWLLDFSEFTEIISGADGTLAQSEIEILEKGILKAKQHLLRSDDSERRLTVDTPVPYRINELIEHIDAGMGVMEKSTDTAPYRKLMSRLKALQQDPRYGFMFGSVAIRDNMKHILARIFRVPSEGKPLSILDLSGVPSEIVNVVVSVLCRLAFDLAMRMEGTLPILLVCEEAHRYAPRAESGGFEPSKRALARIAREGRKYGVSLCLVSQRPSEIDTGILSQCNTIFAMRLSNQTDQEILRAVVSDSSLGIVEILPSLGNAEALAVGSGVPVPMILHLDQLPEESRPKSETACFTEIWKHEDGKVDALDRALDAWRWNKR